MKKGGSEKRRISATGRFLLPSVKAEWNCVGGSAGHFSKSARNGAPPVVSVDVKKQTRVILRR
jgi:hypothetical protein